MRMKTRLLSIALAAFLTFAVVGQAKAYFEDGQVTMFAYYELGNEVGYDLGELASMDFSGSPVELAPPGTFDFLTETGAPSLDLVKVGIYVGSDVSYRAGFVTTLADTEPLISMANVSNFWTGIDGIRGFYGDGASITDPKVSGIYGVLGSYGQAMGAPGSYGAFHDGDIAIGELSLADEDSLSDLYLYHFVYPGSGSDLVLDPGAPTLHKAVIDIGLDGSVILNNAAVNPVPIPGAALLFGSGLLGLVGIRRRKSA